MLHTRVGSLTLMMLLGASCGGRTPLFGPADAGAPAPGADLPVGVDSAPVPDRPGPGADVPADPIAFDLGESDIAPSCNGLDLAACRANPACVVATCLLQCNCMPAFTCLDAGGPLPGCPAAQCDGGPRPQCCHSPSDCQAGDECVPPGVILCGGGVPVGGACTTSAECVTGLCQDGICQEPGGLPGCAADSDCPSGEVCGVGACQVVPSCLPVCRSDSDCLVDQACDQAGHCAARPCPDGACPPGFMCQATPGGAQCQRLPCITDNDCPDGYCVNQLGGGAGGCYSGLGSCQPPPK
jgi:hypothetical protein